MSTVGRVDLRPLAQAPPRPSAVRAFQADVRRGVYGRDVTAPKSSALRIVVISALCIVGLVVAAVFIVAGITAQAGKTVSLGIGLLAGVVTGLCAFIASAQGIPQAWHTWFALAAFARANEWGTQPNAPAPNYPGMPFHQGHSQRLAARVYRNEPRFFDVAHLTFSTEYGKSRKEHTWTYLAMKLDRRIPHVVLDGLSNNGPVRSNLPSVMRRKQILSLEGDFDKYFTLYCPQGYERDALTIFTPDLMALLIDNVEAFDVEIIDDWLFVYSSRSLPLGDPQTWMRLLRIIDTVGAKIVSQTAHYTDDRLVPASTPPLQRMASTHNIVGSSGHRLRVRSFGSTPLIILTVGVGIVGLCVTIAVTFS